MRPDASMRRLRGSAPTPEPREPGNEGRARFMSVLAQATPAELATDYRCPGCHRIVDVIRR